MFSTLKNYLSTNNPTEADGSKRNPHKAYKGANLDVIEVKQKTIHGKKRIVIGMVKAKHARKADKERGKSSPVMQALASQQPNRSLVSIAGRISDRKHSNRTSMSRMSMASVDAAHPGANLLNHSSYDGFTSIKLNLSNFTVKVLRPVHMFGLDRVEIRVENLIKKFVQNWKEWLGKVTGQTAQITEWVVNTCRHKNVFLQKFLVEELDPAKAVSEKAVIEVIFGPQPIIKQPLKRSLEEQPTNQPATEKQARRRESVSVGNWDTKSRSTQQEGQRGLDGSTKSPNATEP